MQNKKHFSPAKLGKKSGFTLVEMLIVIVIIGILAAALIPRLTSARGRANDVARKASLQQIATALISYQIDNAKFPSTAGGVNSSISGELIAGGMASIPKDPAGASLGSGIKNVTIPAGEFGYTPIKKNGQAAGGVVLMTTMETTNGANYVICGAGDEIDSNSEFNTIQGKICSKVTFSTPCSNATTDCTALAASGSLRYIYVY